MIFNDIQINLGESYRDVALPAMYKVQQLFDNTKLDNPEYKIQRQCEKFISREQFEGKRIAITVGSRGIAEFPLIIKTLISGLKNAGATPFIIPAMGSHGGATAEGQREFIESYGITEEYVGIPIVSSMSVIEIGQTAAGLPVYCDEAAYNSDGIVVMNKIKPHADFKGDHESGLVKMMAVGLGKHKGAKAIHSHGFQNMASLLPQYGEIILKKAPIVFGVSILENPYDSLFDVEFIPGKDIVKREKELLKKAKSLMPRLNFSEIDVLIIGEIGKDISGEGMDPNITGRPGSGQKEGFKAPVIQKIVVLDVTRNSHGNGVGIGMADISTISCLQKLDISAMYTNAFSSTILNPAKIPVIANTDEEAIKSAVLSSVNVNIDDIKIVWIKNTLDVGNIFLSESLFMKVKNDSSFRSEGIPLDFSFSEEGCFNGFKSVGGG